LLNSFGAKTINAVMYMLKKSITNVVEGKTLKEVCLRKKCDNQHLRMFLSKAFVHFPKEKEEQAGQQK
jgi:hypothetical protein